MKIEKLLADTFPAPSTWELSHFHQGDKGSELIVALANSAAEIVALVKAAQRHAKAGHELAIAESNFRIAQENFTDPEPELDKASNAAKEAMQANTLFLQALAALNKHEAFRDE